MERKTSELAQHWRIVVGAFAGIGAGFASLYFYTAGLFIKPLSHEFGWTRSEASLGAIAIMVGNAIALPVAGRLIDRYGELRVAAFSGAALAATFAMLGWLTAGLASFLSLVLLLTMVSAGSNAIGYNRMIVRHFQQQRGLALGLALTGTAVGAAAFPPILGPLIEICGWRAGYGLLSISTIVLTGCALLLLRSAGAGVALAARPPARQKDEGQSWQSIVGHSAFLPTSAMIFLSSMAVLGTTMHLVPFLGENGKSPSVAGAIASALGFSVIFGRIAAGYLLDRFDAGLMTFALLSLASGGTLLLWTGLSWLFVPGAILVGFGVGTEGDLLAFLLGRRFPVSSFGSVYGAIFGVHALGAGAGGMLAGALFDWTGNYDAWMLLAACLLIVAGLIGFVSERNVPPHRTTIH
ncbi:MFS transporter [Novosphingobium sp. MMS21-SN21R]|uniref:MFS transporter n=1 Tax=Novosphingobium sp. MMS21-SN21R TaxID=2969298 RepID=UPI00288777DE|nr:MFS transporter [Novosphingobium sp. MMS21-SN21R]MDT0510247.1 MFS transporter [Novosphingobium sp. MMS21-SN21R]